MSQVQQANKNASKLLTAKVETKLLAVCDVTGIAITIEAPAIGYALNYTNPLALPVNFLQLAELPFSTLSKFEPSILAGLVLAVLKNWDMIEENTATLSAAEQNLLLQAVPPYSLINYMRFFAANLAASKAAYSYLPKLSIQPRLSGEMPSATITNTLKEHQRSCAEILFPAKDKEELNNIYSEVETIAASRSEAHTKKIAEAILRARRTKEAQQKSSLIEARKLLKSLKEASILSDKFLAFLGILLSGDYLLTAEQSTKDRAIQALAKHQLPTCSQLIRIIKDPCFASTVDSLFAHEDDVEVEEVLEAVEAEEQKVAIVNPLAALLKAKLAAMADKKVLPAPAKLGSSNLSTSVEAPVSCPSIEEMTAYEESQNV